MIRLLALLLRLAALVAALEHELPALTPADRVANAAAAMAAEGTAAPAELLLAIGWRESRLQRDPGGRCGVVQVALHGAACRRARGSLTGGYAAGARILRDWTALCRRMRAPSIERCRDNGYAAGIKAARDRQLDRGAGVRARAARLRAWSMPPIAEMRPAS